MTLKKFHTLSLSAMLMAMAASASAGPAVHARLINNDSISGQPVTVPIGGDIYGPVGIGVQFHTLSLSAMLMAMAASASAGPAVYARLVDNDSISGEPVTVPIEGDIYGPVGIGVHMAAGPGVH